MKVRVIKKNDNPSVHPDLVRLVKSMQTLLRRRYPDPLERHMIAVRIMGEVQKAA
jgi:hypothetical protein